MELDSEYYKNLVVGFDLTDKLRLIAHFCVLAFFISFGLLMILDRLWFAAIVFYAFALGYFWLSAALEKTIFIGKVIGNVLAGLGYEEKKP